MIQRGDRVRRGRGRVDYCVASIWHRPDRPARYVLERWDGEPMRGRTAFTEDELHKVPETHVQGPDRG
jgi:hypothetical protein